MPLRSGKRHYSKIGNYAVIRYMVGGTHHVRVYTYNKYGVYTNAYYCSKAQFKSRYPLTSNPLAKPKAAPKPKPLTVLAYNRIIMKKVKELAQERKSKITVTRPRLPPNTDITEDQEDVHADDPGEFELGWDEWD